MVIWTEGIICNTQNTYTEPNKWTLRCIQTHINIDIHKPQAIYNPSLSFIDLIMPAVIQFKFCVFSIECLFFEVSISQNKIL